jgi:hypothetical protein
MSFLAKSTRAKSAYPMNKKRLSAGLLLFLIFGIAIYSYNLEFVKAASLIGTETLVLYDAASGTIPGQPLISFTDFPPGAAVPTYSNGVTILDTTTAGSDTYAGWISNGMTTPGFPILDRTEGFQVNFTIQIESESHTRNHRAGFSLIVLSEDARGIELAFWQNELWAQGDDLTGGLFRRGEAVSFATTSALTDYQLTIVGDTYTLTANATPILSGPMRDYSAFEGFPDPYETPNFLFLGDNTTSAQTRVQLSFVSITGSQPVSPTTTSTITSTSNPVPTASFTPLPSATPVPSPTPAGRGFEFCPSGWLLAVMVATMVSKRIKPVKDPRQDG